jgi:predicted metalloprotease
MELEDREESENVEDRRGIGVKTGAAVGVGGLLILIVTLLLGGDPQKVLQQLGQNQGAQQGAPAGPANPEEEKQAHFTKVVFGDTERVWGDLFQKMGKRYPKPTLVLYTGVVDSGCGQAESSVGPFYCPADSKVYIDLSFYQDMQRKLNAPGDFARAYVVAHEVGHHVQRLLGYSKRVDEARSSEANQMSVRLELQADYLAGVWAHHAEKQFKKFLDPGDIESALNAANEIGDDRLQKKARGTVRPDTFTHGSSAQRVRWFKKGFDTGSIEGAAQLFELPYDQL